MANRVARPKFPESHPQLLFQAASVPFTGSGLQDDAHGESMVPFYQAMMPMEWHQPLDSPEGYLPTSVHWFQPPSFGGGRTASSSFVSELSETDAGPWSPRALAPGVNGQFMPLEWSVESAVDVGYSLMSLEPGPPSSLSPWAPQEHGELVRLPNYQLQSTGNCNGGHDRKRRAHPHTDAEERIGARKKRGHPLASIQTAGADADLPRYVPIVSRGSTLDLSLMPVTPSPPDSAAAPSFASPDACYYYQLGGTVMAPPSPAHMLTPSQTASPESPRRKRTRTRRPSDTAIHTASRTRSPSTSPTAITTETTTPTAQRSETIAQTQSQSQHQAQGQDQANQATPTTQSQTRDRNRAAASRYRAKTQAAFAQLEAAEREGSVRRQSLLTCASQLRDELFQLKNELLRHAGCDCPLIQGYLSHAAEVASAGLRYSNGSQRLGQGEGLVGRSHLRT